MNKEKLAHVIRRMTEGETLHKTQAHYLWQWLAQAELVPPEAHAGPLPQEEAWNRRGLPLADLVRTWTTETKSAWWNQKTEETRSQKDAGKNPKAIAAAAADNAAEPGETK